MVGRDGNEVALETWEQLSAADPMSDRAYEQLVVGVAARKYARSLEPLSEELVESERSTKKSTVRRKFVAASQARLDDWPSRDLGALDLVAVFIDGLHFAEHVALVALGVDAQGKKHVLGLWEMLIVMGLGLSHTLERSSALTSPVENVNAVLVTSAR